MLDNITKKRIDDCRDILVGKLPDPKSQIEQITIALIYKFMDDMDKEAMEMGGTAQFFSGEFAKYSWDSLFDARVTAAQMLALYSEAIESMEKNPNIPRLFRDIFKNAYLPYRDPETLKLFLKTIGGFDYSHSEKLGDAFEYLLSVMGSQGDAGQFRTPRHIIDFLVAAVDPGKGDTVLDPACGTAGFLISAFKHIKQQNQQLTPDEQKRLIRNFTGYDISPDMVRLSLVNLYLHGFTDPRIWEYDTLSSEERWDETYDVILANPPFMSPKGGIRPHKKFSINSNRSEVLFVDYIAEHLNPKGRAGIIVPEGVIFQSGTAYKDLRKMLVENYLYAVVSLPAGVFNPYSGVKTSILLMDKELAKKTSNILFVKIENDGYNLGAQRAAVKGSQLEEALNILTDFKHSINTKVEFNNSTHYYTVAKTEIAKNGEYNLGGERYKSSIVSNSSYEFVELNTITKLITDGTHQTPKYTDNGVPFFRVTDLTLSSSSKKYISPEEHKELIKRCKPEKGDILYSKNGTIGVAKLIDWDFEFSIFVSLALLKLHTEKIIPKYLEILLNSEQALVRAKGFSKSGTVTNLHLIDIKRLQIPLPPLTVQEEIVSEIVAYQNIIDGAKSVVENYKPKIDIDPEWEVAELGQICDVRDGTHDSPKYLQDGGIPLITQKNITKYGLSFSNVNFISMEDHLSISKRSKVDFGDIIISMIGANRGMSCLIDNEQDFSIKNVGLIKSQGLINQEYLLIYLQSPDALKHVSNMSTGGAQEFISLKTLRTFPIPIPPTNIQSSIVSQIEKEQSLVNANKQLIQIFEQKIKDRIAKVWGTSAAPVAAPVEETLALAAEPEEAYS